MSERNQFSLRHLGPADRQKSSQLSVHRALGLSDDEVDTIIQGFADADETSGKTWTRRLVEDYLCKKKWYFPRAGDTSAPSLPKAYAYYEHITLPRHFAEGRVEHVLRRAEPGENVEDTELYNPFTTPASSLIEWGIGVDLYFSSLRSLGFLLFLAGLMNIPSIMHYASDEYSENGQSSLESMTLKGSAVCTTTDWVVCDPATCTAELFDDDGNERKRFGVAPDGTVLIERNLCDGVTYQTLLTNLFTLFFITIVMVLLSLYWGAREVRFDEDKITSTDYSIEVKNPPKDAYDPDEWNNFFSQFALKQVTCVSIALNNDDMVRKLIERREARAVLELQLPKGTDMDDEDLVRTLVAQLVRDQESEPKGCVGRILSCITPILNIFGILLPPDKLVDKVFRLTEEIKEHQKEVFDVVRVYVTFESEEGQRAALTALSVGKFDAITNNTTNIPQAAVFRDRVLKVSEPCEPDAVRWLDLSAGAFRRYFFRGVNLAITMGIVALAVLVVDVVRAQASPTIAAYLVTVLNSTVPQVLKILMILERHSTAGGFQTSLYLKITLFRWINTAILTKVITPVIGTLTSTDTSILPTINSILWSELWLTPLLRLSDWLTNLKKHVLAPRARTQDQMNNWFQGTYYNLGERYTDLTKILFVVFVYSALFPAAFFFGAAILYVQYYTDKYCLMRIWGWIPTIGAELPKFSRRYFFSGSILALCILSAYAWAQFPYDNLCVPEETSGEDFSGSFTNVSLPLVDDADPFNVTVSSSTQFVFCAQSWREVSGLSFPPTPRIQPEGKNWMAREGDMTKERLISLYGWTALVYLVVYLVVMFGTSSWLFFMSFFRGTYSPDGQNQRVDFSSLTEKAAYVPQIKLIGRPFPYLACNIDHLDQDLIGWNDPARSYDYYNLIFDVPYPGMPRKKRIKGNTRDTRQIDDQSEFNMNPTHFDSEDKGNVTVQGDDTGVEVTKDNTKFPIFSTVKHYPPPWLKAIYEEEQKKKKQKQKET